MNSSSWSPAHVGPFPPSNDPSLLPDPKSKASEITWHTGQKSTWRQRTHRVKTSGNVGRRASAVRQLALACVARVAGGVGGGRRSRQRALILGEGGEAKGEDDEERFGQHPGRPCEERSRGRMRLRGGWWWSKKERSDWVDRAGRDLYGAGEETGNRCRQPQGRRRLSVCCARHDASARR